MKLLADENIPASVVMALKEEDMISGGYGSNHRAFLTLK